MRNVISRLWQQFRCDERGNIAVLLGAAAIPILLVMGGAIDFTRYNRHRAELSNAVDTAALALARNIEITRGCTEIGAECEAASQFVTTFVESFYEESDRFTVEGLTATRTETGFRVQADAEMGAIFLPLGNHIESGTGQSAIDADVTTEVVNASNRLELALVLDNTGSMNCAGAVTIYCAASWSSPETGSRIVALKDAAKTLVDTLMTDDMEDPDQIRIALVPFEGTVNVASTGFSVTNPPNWIDWRDQAAAKYSGRNFNQRNFGGAIGTKHVGHKWLFNKLTADDSRVTWAGCVEMRAGTYELSDVVPDPAIPDSLFVPYFAPDEPDSNPPYGYYLNNYLEDRVTGAFDARQKSLTKYSSNNEIRWHSGRMDWDASTSPYEYGPNRGCPKPIVPLTNADGGVAIKTAIDSMIGYWASGTYIPAGLIWGWNVLSPDIPYTEGIAPGHEDYEDTVKAVVLLTDGDNEVPALGNHNEAAYSAYSYVTLQVDSAYRLGSTASAAANALDTRTSSLCTSVKNSGIRLYTITFGPLSSETQTMMRNCATLDENGTGRLHYHAPTSNDLANIFTEIGEDLRNIHLSM